MRWATPVIFMRRNLKEDVELGGVTMKAGDKVSMWYNSANRDETNFDNPWLFDVTRKPNPHNRIPDIAAVEEPAILRSAFLNGIKRLPVSWTPAGH